MFSKRTPRRLLAAVMSAALAWSAFPALPPVSASQGITESAELTGREANDFSYHRDFANGLGNLEKISSGGILKAGNGSASMTGDGIFIDQDSVAAKNTEVEFAFNPKNVSCNYGVILRYVSEEEYLYVGPSSQYNQHYTSWAVYSQSGKLADIEDAGFVLDGRETPYQAKVRVVDDVVTVFLDHELIYSGVVNGMTENAGKIGFRTTQSSGMDVYGFTQRSVENPAESTESQGSFSISSSEMTVSMDQSFPRVISYALTGGASVSGQTKPIHRVEINNTVYDNPAVTAQADDDSVTYHMAVSAGEISYAFDISYTVNGNVLEMKLLHIDDAQDKIYTINFPEQCMVSLPSTAPNAKLRVNNYKNETVYDLASRSAEKGFSATSLAVLSCDSAAAAISGESYKNRKEIAYQTTDCGAYTSTGLWLNEFTYRGVDGEIEIEEPWVKAAVVGDCNNDGKIDYQDGAVALRDLCMKRKTGAGTAVSSWNMIAMNVGSEAQYPFLRILDNIKKIHLATDGFGQNVIIKGYQSEGHDASHPDFANYNRRAGGLSDLVTLLEESEQYNAKVGVHINHTDVYPEAPQYAKLASGLSAWSWYDTSMGIIRENDCLDTSANGLDGRLSRLFDTDTSHMLDTVYVDVFFGTRWPMYKLVRNISGRGMALGTEYVDEMVSYSVFAHHIGSAFGGAGNLVRFVNNNQADIFTNHPLFRGADSRANEQIGIDGWQGAKNLNTALTAFYTKILPNKYLANFPVMQYETDNRAVLGENGEVITEMTNGVNIITKNGKRIAEGNKMFIPWDPKTEEKIYHYNPDGGASTWELPDSWKDVTSVKVYRLSDEGRNLADTLTVSAGKITIQAEAGTGYVLCKGDAENTALHAETMDWSTGSPVRDMGFDSHGFGYWKKDENASHIVIENNSLGNSHLYIRGTQAGEVSQTITGLTPGETYSASVWTITDEGKKASIRVDTGTETVENYMTRSNVLYGYHHSDKYQTYAQRMSVRFTAGSDTAILTLAAEAGNSANSSTDFDDVRVMACGITDPGTHTYYEDFENVDQGLGIFVSTESDQSHLSQKNPLNPEYTPDVISGTYSLKVRTGDYMRTLPSTMRFLPDTEYTISLEYKSAAAEAFTLGVKSDRARESGDTNNAVLAEAVPTLGNMTKGTLELTFTTGDYDDYYMDITKKNAAEYVIDNVAVDAAVPMTAESLQKLLASADSMTEKDYTPASWNILTEAIRNARNLLNTQITPSTEDITSVYTTLETAIKNAERYADREERTALQTMTNELKKLRSSDYIMDIGWMNLQILLKEADTLAQNSAATSPQISRMMQSLETAKSSLTPAVDRSRIRAAIAKAEAVNRSAITDGMELQSFLGAMEDAIKINQTAGVTKEEIANAAAKLESAYQALTIKDSSLNGMITAALEKSEVDAAYFPADALSEIQETRTALESLWGGSGIFAHAFYDIMESLDAALSRKQDTPVLSDSLALESGSFTITCDNENPLSGSEGPASLAFDGDANTIWHSNYTPVTPLPATIEIDLGAEYPVNQFSYQCRPTGSNGKVTDYSLSYLEAASGSWLPILEGGSFVNDTSVEKVSFAPVTTRKIRFVVNQGEGGFGSAAELAVYRKTADKNGLQIQLDAFRRLDSSQYTPASLAALESLIRQAQVLLEDTDASQESVDALLKQIQAAADGLSLLPSQTDLQVLKAVIRDAEAEDPAAYKNPESFLSALADAKKALAAPTDQQAVQNASFSLYQAHHALIEAGKKPASEPAPGPAASQNLSAAAIAPIASQTYTGKPLTPQVSVTLGGTALRNGTDYTLSYQANTNPGKALVTITGKGHYTGTRTASFHIVPKKAALKKAVKYRAKAIKLTWKRDKKADGYQICCSTNKKFKKGVRRILVKKNKTVTKIVKKLKSRTVYYVRIRSYKTIDGKKVFGSFGKAKKVKTR